MSSQVSPRAQAAALRATAATLSGAERDHLLWLANEWDRTAARYEPGGPAPRPLTSQDDRAEARA